MRIYWFKHFFVAVTTECTQDVCDYVYIKLPDFLA